MKKILNKIFVFIGVCAVSASCSFFDVEPQVICSDTFYNTKSEVEYGLAGVYGAMNHEHLYGNYYSQMYSNVDDLSYFNRDISTNYLQYNRHDAGTAQIYNIWVKLYEGIRNANAFMEAVVKTEFDENGLYYNEARFLRAYYHFLLAQAWGDVPMRKQAVTKHDEVMIASSPQFEVLSWVAAEMEACVALAPEELDNAPSRVVKTTVQGILARVYLFMAGESVKGGDKADFLDKAMSHADAVIKTGKHKLNKDYSQIFINMIKDQYDKEYNESMWEVDFLGDRSSAENWSNGRIGDVIGLQSTAGSGYEQFNCNYSYGQYDGSL